MITALTRFVEALRREGVRVSPAEALEAARALELVGLEQRERVRAALAATLAKGHREREVFARLFERFFAPPATGLSRGRGARGGGGGEGTARGRGTAPVSRTPSHRPGERDAPPRHRRGPAEARRDRERAARLAQALEARAQRRKRRTRVVLASRTGARGVERGGAPGTARPAREVDLTRPLPPDEERRLAEAVPELVRELRLRRLRRQARAARGRLWLRQLFRRNVATEGVPFVLPRRRSRRGEPAVTLFVDLSYSVARVTGYFLWMAVEFLRGGTRVRVVGFVDRAVDLTGDVAAWLRGRAAPAPPAPSRRASSGPLPGRGLAPGGVSFADWLAHLPGLDPRAPSDYGRALHGLLESPWRPRRQGVLVVLGDARTNRFDPLPWALEELAQGCRAVVWLVPEPRERWATGDSALDLYAPYVDVLVEAWSLDALARGLDRLGRSLQ